VNWKNGDGVSSFEMEKHRKEFVYSFAKKLPTLVVGCKIASPTHHVYAHRNPPDRVWFA